MNGAPFHQWITFRKKLVHCNNIKMRKTALTKYSLITVYHFKSKFTSYFLYTGQSIFLKWLDEVWTDQAPLVLLPEI